MQRLTGTSVPRVEDGRILTGRGTFIDDRRPPGTLHAAFVRSPFPHARLGAIDVSEAIALPGVVAVLTAADLAGIARPLQLAGGPDTLAKPGYQCLATDKVRLVGDPVRIGDRRVAPRRRGRLRAGGRRLRGAPRRRLDRPGPGPRRPADLGRPARRQRRVGAPRHATAIPTPPSRAPTGWSRETFVPSPPDQLPHGDAGLRGRPSTPGPASSPSRARCRAPT